MEYSNFTSQYFFIHQTVCGNPHNRNNFLFFKLFNLASYYKKETDLPQDDSVLPTIVQHFLY